MRSSQSSIISSIYNKQNQTEKDRIAFQNTKKVIQQKQQMKKQYTRWTPQSINSDNALFSQVVPQHKPIRKQNPIKKIQINIFDLQSNNFKPCVKRTQLSHKNSNLFTDQQKYENWRSTSKKAPCPVSRQFTPQKTFKTSQLNNSKKTSIDLRWTSVQLQKSTDLSQSKGISNSRKGSYLYQTSIKF